MKTDRHSFYDSRDAKQAMLRLEPALRPALRLAIRSKRADRTPKQRAVLRSYRLMVQLEALKRRYSLNDKRKNGSA